MMINSSHHQLITNLIESELTIGESIQFIVTSNSMQPVLQIGDSIVAEVISCEDVKPGDIIVTKRSEDFLTHRVILKTEEGWLTKGDNNAVLDPPVQKTSFIGRVRAVHKTNRLVVFESPRWRWVNRVLARLGEIEVRAILHHHILGLPFRICSKGIRKFSLLTVS